MKKLLMLSSIIGVSLIFAAPPPKDPTAAKTQAEKIENPKTGAPAANAPEGDAVVVKEAPAYFPGGCGFRKALGGLVKVYQICFFGKNMKAPDWASSFDAPANTKAFKLKLSFLRGVGGKNVSAAFSEGLSKTPAAQKLEELERQKFLGWAAKLKIEKNSVMEFSFNEGKAMQVAFFEKAEATTQAQSFESDQKGFAKATAAIWFGDKPINEDLKKDLLK